MENPEAVIREQLAALARVLNRSAVLTDQTPQVAAAIRWCAEPFVQISDKPHLLIACWLSDAERPFPNWSSSAYIMQKLIVLIFTLFVAHLYIGFYETRWAEDNKRVFFIKKYPSLQVEFVNLFASDADDKLLEQLSPLERATVRDYCKFRLGIETHLETQEELNACKAR